MLFEDIIGKMNSFASDSEKSTFGSMEILLKEMITECQFSSHLSSLLEKFNKRLVEQDSLIETLRSEIRALYKNAQDHEEKVISGNKILESVSTELAASNHQLAVTKAIWKASRNELDSVKKEECRLKGLVRIYRHYFHGRVRNGQKAGCQSGN